MQSPQRFEKLGAVIIVFPIWNRRGRMSIDPLISQRGSTRLRSVIDNLSLLRAFVAVVETGNFSHAGHRLRVVPSTISKHISALESRLHGQLFIRSTQKLSITELGQRLYERAVSILSEVEATEIEIGDYNAEPQGLLKISAGPIFAQRHLAPVLTSFLQKYPKIKLEVSLSTSSEDMITAGFDVAIRISNALAPGLIALKLASNSRVYCASPSYLERFGTPAIAADLLKHNCLVIQGVSQSARWAILNENQEWEQVNVSGNLQSDNGDMIRQALLGGIGIGHMALFMVHDHLANGELVELFPESRTVASHIYAIYPERRNMPLKTRAFIDHLKDAFRQAPAWMG